MPATPATIRAALADPSSFATTLVAAAAGAFGTDALLGRDGDRWDPATLRHELADELGVVLSPSQFDRLMAGIALLTTDRFRRSAADFCALAAALNGDGHSDALWDPPSAEDAAWAVTEDQVLERLFFGRAGRDEEWSPGVRALVGAIGDHEGLVDPPDVLRLGTIPGRKARERILTSHTADPETYAAIRGSQDARNAAILAELRGRMRLLLGQLASLWRVAPAEATRIIAAAK